VVTTYTYDTQTSELTDVTYSDSTPALAFTYNRLGQQATITDATGTRNFDYDPATLQLTAENLDATFYDGLVLTRQYQDGTELHGLKGRASGYSLGTQPSPVASAAYSYTEQGRLHTITDGTDTFTYDYKTNSNLLASMEGPVHGVSYSYEPNRDLMSSIDNKAGNLTGSSISKYTYQHDALNRRTSRVQQGTAFTQATFDAFDYNDRGEVIESKRYTGTDVTDKSNPLAPVAFGYEYDPIGNRIQSSTGILPVTDYTTNSLNQYTLFGVSGSPREPKHDKDGNLTETGDGWFYKWDAENRLIKAQNYQFTPDAGSKRLYFIYDYQSRRVAKTVEEWNGTTWVETSDHRYLYDGWNLIAKYEFQSSQFTLHSSFLWGLDLSQSIHGAGGVGGLLSVTEHAGTHQGTYVYTYDANGNVGQVLNSTGATVAEYEYDPFGNIINQTGTYADVNVFRFSTKYFDVETGLYYYGFRYLDPETGRWLNRDPIAEAGGLNLYVFVGNNAIWFIDAHGEFGFIGAAIGAVSGGVGGFIAGSSAGGLSGALKGAVIGTAVGASVGLVAPQASGVLAGAVVGAAIGGTSSVAGQVAGGLVNNQTMSQSIANVDLGAVAGATVGGAAGGAWSAANTLVNGIGLSNQLAGAFGDGFITGVGEFVGYFLGDIIFCK